MAEDPAAELPVQLNDVVFTLHALFACTIVVIQCLLYDVSPLLDRNNRKAKYNE